jgi:TonB family protein
MRRITAAALCILFWAIILVPKSSFAQQEQQDQPESVRKVVNRVVPQYPELARTMNLKGTVRVEALVLPNGSVKSVEVKGGHPVLAQAAENAIHKWKWQPAKTETREPIEVKFDPH